MASLLDGLAEPFARIEPSAAVALLDEVWGIEAGELTRLDTERDDTFRVETPDGAVVLKVAHPADPIALIALQSTALEHVRRADPGIPVQRVVPTIDRALYASRPAAADGRAARVLTWLPGDLMLDGQVSDALLRDCGRAQARLALALRDLDDPAADRAFAWDIAQLPDLRPDTDDPLLLGVIDRFESEIAPALERLPRQIIHNDFHPGNVLIDPARPGVGGQSAVAGLLDFGDLVRTARVCDLGVALAYLLPEDGPIRPTIDAFIGGYCEVEPLLEGEIALIPDLIVARQVARLLVNAALARQRGETQSAPRVTRALHRILNYREGGD